MTDMKTFKNEIILYAIAFAVFFEIISLPLLGIDLPFLLGLASGTLVTVFNFHLLVLAGEKVMSEMRAKPMVGGYFIRLVIYGAAFLIAIKINYHAAIGCAAGFITLHISVLFTYLIVYGLIRKEKNPLNDWKEPKQWNDLSIYDEEEEDWNFKLKEE